MSAEHLAVKEITNTRNPLEAVELTIIQGGVLLRDCIDVDELDRSIVDANVSEVVINGAGPGVDYSDKIQKITGRIEILASIAEAMCSFSLGYMNAISFPRFEFGFTLPPHADNTFVAQGISMLIPRNHLGDIMLHGDGHFSVGDFYVDDNGIVGRATKYAENPTGLFTERRSTYGRGDILLLRQDVPHLGLKAKVHSVSSSRKSQDTGNMRELVIFDHITTI